MNELLNAPLTIALLSAVGIFGWWHFQRRHTGQKQYEDAAKMEQTLRIKEMMDAQGLSAADVRALRREFLSKHETLQGAEAYAIAVKTSEANANAVSDAEVAGYALDDEPDQVDFRDTTLGMNMELSARYEMLDATLTHDILQTTSSYDEEHRAAFFEAQEKWEAYRSSEAAFASSRYSGGSIAPVIYTARLVELTEERIAWLKLVQAEDKL